MSILEVPVEDLLKVLPFKAAMDVRYYLNGVLVTPHNGGALLVATDGHRIAVCDSKAARTDADYILGIPDDFAEVLKRNRNATLSPESVDARIILRDQFGNEHAVKAGKPFVDGKFPDWRRAIPKASELEPGLMGALNPRYFEGLADPIPAGLKPALTFWRCKEYPAERCSVFRYSGMPELLIAMMPMRVDASPSWPDWMEETKKEAAA